MFTRISFIAFGETRISRNRGRSKVVFRGQDGGLSWNGDLTGLRDMQRLAMLYVWRTSVQDTKSRARDKSFVLSRFVGNK